MVLKEVERKTQKLNGINENPFSSHSMHDSPMLINDRDNFKYPINLISLVKIAFSHIKFTLTHDLATALIQNSIYFVHVCKWSSLN